MNDYVTILELIFTNRIFVEILFNISRYIQRPVPTIRNEKTFLDNLEEVFPWDYMYSDVISKVKYFKKNSEAFALEFYVNIKSIISVHFMKCYTS